MKKIFINSLFILLLLSTSNLLAEPVSIENAENVAKNWYKERCPEGGIQFDILETFVENIDGEDVFYIFNFTPLGYVIISADDISTPVLGYSYSQNYETINHPPAFDDLLECYALQIDYARDEGIAPFQETIELWQRLNVNPEDFVPESISRAVEPLLTTEWDQGQYYNEMCPYDTRAFPYTGNNYVPAGCVATVMAQVMKYWNYPPIGTGSHGYYDPINYQGDDLIPNSDYGWQYADFGATTYNWTNMPNSVTILNTDVQTLLYHCGVSVEMNYGPYGSVASTSTDVVPALTTYFNYDPDAQFLSKSNYTEPIWEDMIRDELDNGRPLIYRGYDPPPPPQGGHAFNLDGYEGTNHFHFNWGWSGSYNGYYYLSNLNPGGHNYTQGQGGVFGLEPSLFGYVSLDGGTGLLSQVKITFRNFDTGEYECTLWADLNGYFHIPWSQFSPGFYDITFSHASNEYENVLICGMGVFHPGIITPNPVILKYNPDKLLIVPNDYPTIKEAINCIQDDGTVVVLNGTYTGEDNTNLTWYGKHIKVRAQSLNQPENCIIEASYYEEYERAFILNDPNINNSDKIIGFTIRDFYLGQYYYPPELKKGAGIFVYNGASPTIENCIIKNCLIDNEYVMGGSDYTGFGVGIYCEGSTVIKNCIIQENEGWDIQGGAGIACKGNVMIDGCTIRNNLIGKYVGMGGPDVDYAGVGIFACSSENGSPTIINNTIYDNYHECEGHGAAIYVYEEAETDIPVKILNNTIYNNSPAGSYSNAEAICIADGGKPIEICGNLIYNNNTTAVGSHYHWSLGPPVGPYYFTFENNTIMNNHGDGLYIYDGGLTLTKNNIIVGNSNYGIHWDTGTEGLSVMYSILYDNSYGNYDTTPAQEFCVYYIDPKVDSGNNYQPIWTEQLRSPCIDTGDPDPQYNDPDESRSDIGAIPAITHKYDNWQLPPNSVDDGWKWLSFPALDDLTNAPDFDGDVAQYMLEDILDYTILDSVIWKPILIQNSEKIKIEWNGSYWENLDHIFTSPQGYKFNMSDDLQDYVGLEVSGFLEDPNTVIHLWGNLEDNWIGYFLEETQSIEDAFGSAMDNIYSITMQHWGNKRESQEPDAPWIIPESKVKQTVTYGDMLIVKCFDDMDFQWNNNGNVPPHEEMKTSYFNFSEKADYVPIFVELDPEDIPDEIGVLVDGECKGASVVEDTLAQVCAYILGCNGGELEFELYYDNKGTESNLNVKDYFVYNPETKLKEKRTIKIDENKEYYLVSFKADESETIPKHFSIQNFPNPFNPDILGTTIQYALPKETDVTITIYNIKGQLVKRIVKGMQSPGIYNVIWDGKDEPGKSISNGIYFYKLETNNKTLIKKMLLVR